MGLFLIVLAVVVLAAIVPSRLSDIPNNHNEAYNFAKKYTA